jgi:ectoine hydroxylase
MNALEDLYPTRMAEEQIIERVDPVVYGTGECAGEHSLSPGQLDFYERNGYLVVPGVFSREEVESFKEEFVRMAGMETLRHRDEVVLEPDSDEVRSIFSLHQLSDRYERLSRDRRVLDKVHQILDSDVYIHHSRINIKRPLNGKSFPWHSDFETWHAEDGLPRCRVLSAWVMLTQNDEFNGPLYVMSGSHRWFVACPGQTPDDHYKESLRKQEYGVPSLSALEALAGRGGGLAAAHGRAGTLVLHEGNAMHGSPDNISPRPRTNLFFVYNSVHNTPAVRPFAAGRFRPAFLGGRDYTPLEPVDNAA